MHKQLQMRAVRVYKTTASPCQHAELLSYLTVHVPSNFGHVSNSSAGAVAGTLQCSWRCTAGPFAKPKQVFKKQLLALLCLHLGSLLHSGVPQPPKSQMVPLAWCPTADSEQTAASLTGQPGVQTSPYLLKKNQFSCMYSPVTQTLGILGVSANPLALGSLYPMRPVGTPRGAKPHLGATFAHVRPVGAWGFACAYHKGLVLTATCDASTQSPKPVTN